MTTNTADASASSAESQQPTKEDIIAFLKEQIEVKTLQVQLSELNSRIATLRADEIKALAFIGQMTNPPKNPSPDVLPEDAIPHTVTQEDLDANPDLAIQGVKLGDEVMIENPESFKERKLKKD